MADPVGDIIGDYRAFTAQQRDRLLARGIDIAPYELGHLAVRVPEWDQYLHLRTTFIQQHFQCIAAVFFIIYNNCFQHIGNLSLRSLRFLLCVLCGSVSLHLRMSACLQQGVTAKDAKFRAKSAKFDTTGGRTYDVLTTFLTPSLSLMVSVTFVPAIFPAPSRISSVL